MTYNKEDILFMKAALRESLRGKGFTKLNPIVGAIIVKNNKIISKGYHKFYGGPHAEIEALNYAGEEANDADLYVTLEPCSTTMKTPPCTDAIIKAGIRKVIIAEYDPNPANSKKGVQILREASIQVTTDILAKEARKNTDFFHTLIEKKRPFITLKLAMSFDGKIATSMYDSKWITNEKARLLVHKLRHENDGILVGKNTVLIDNPHLTVRKIKAKRQPDKIILDSSGTLPLNKNVFTSVAGERIFIAVSKTIRKVKLKQYKGKGIIPLVCLDKNNPEELLKQLLEYEIGSVLVEGGGQVAGNLFKHQLIDKMILFYAPIIISGNHSINAFLGQGASKISTAIKLVNIKFRKVKDNFLIEGIPQYQ